MIRVAIFQRQTLDSEALTALFREEPDFQVVCTTCLPYGLAVHCRAMRPEATILDASFPGTRSLIAELVGKQYTKCAVVLAGEVTDGAATNESLHADVTYVSRSASFNELLRQITDKVGQLDPTSGEPTGLFKGGSLKPEPISSLTAREMQVFEILAGGKSTRGCAEVMGLPIGTVARHKTMLMKRLGIRNSMELVRLAIREGLLAP